MFRRRLVSKKLHKDTVIPKKGSRKMDPRILEPREYQDPRVCAQGHNKVDQDL